MGACPIGLCRKEGVRNVDIGFEALQVIAFLMVVIAQHVSCRQLGEQEIREGRRHRFTPHIGPDDTAGLVRRIGSDLDRLAEIGVELGRRIDDPPLHVELPAVVDAAQTTIFVATVDERHAAVRTELVEQADTTVRVAKRDQPFSQELDSDRRAVGFRQSFGEHRRQPVATECLAHRRSGVSTHQELVLFPRNTCQDAFSALKD